MTSQEKTKFRRTSKWKKFCKQLKNERGLVCQCCGVKTKRLSVHHMAEWDYTNLKKDRFVLLCRRCHEQVTFVERIKTENRTKYNVCFIAFYSRFLIEK